MCHSLFDGAKLGIIPVLAKFFDCFFIKYFVHELMVCVKLLVVSDILVYG